MHTETICIVGAGGHAKVVVDAMLASGIEPSRIRVSDNNPAMEGTMLIGLRVAYPAVCDEMVGAWFHIAIGNNPVRRQLHARLLAIGARPLSIVHPRASVSQFAEIGNAVFVAANAVIGPCAAIGDGVIVNHGAVADHDCVVGQFSHVAPNATLGGGVKIGPEVLLGAGATVLPTIIIGANAVIGAGAVVLNNVRAAHTCVGVPAVSISKE